MCGCEWPISECEKFLLVKFNWSLKTYIVYLTVSAEMQLIYDFLSLS
jgi:hypothetical protein